MSDRWGRRAPLVGLLFLVLIVIAIVGSGESPEASATPAQVVAYYTRQSSNVKTFDIVFIFAFLAFVLFGAALRAYLRRTARAEAAASLALAGSVLLSAGVVIGTSVELGLAENISHLTPSAAQALNLITDEIFVVALAGAFLFGLGSGIAILRGAALPKWLGWVAIVIGVAAVIPPVSVVALLALVLWTAVVSVLAYLRDGSGRGAPAARPGAEDDPNTGAAVGSATA